MNLQYFYILFIGVIVLWVFQDPNVPRYIELQFELLRINIARWFMARKLKRQLDKDYNDMQKAMKEWMKENGKDQM
jgi:hypothetical protein